MPMAVKHSFSCSEEMRESTNCRRLWVTHSCAPQRYRNHPGAGTGCSCGTLILVLCRDAGEELINCRWLWGTWLWNAPFRAPQRCRNRLDADGFETNRVCRILHRDRLFVLNRIDCAKEVVTDRPEDDRNQHAEKPKSRSEIPLG